MKKDFKPRKKPIKKTIQAQTVEPEVEMSEEQRKKSLAKIKELGEKMRVKGTLSSA